MNIASAHGTVHFIHLLFPPTRSVHYQFLGYRRENGRLIFTGQRYELTSRMGVPHTRVTHTVTENGQKKRIYTKVAAGPFNQGTGNDFNHRLKRKNFNYSPLFLTGETFWKIQITKLHSPDYSFGMRLLEVISGPGQGHYCVEFVGQRPAPARGAGD